MSNFKIELDPREDKDNQIYFLSKKSGPLILNLKKGVAFLIFTSEDGNEELQIANLDNDTGHYSTYYRKDDRLKIRLDKRQDSYGKTFYVGKVKTNFTVDCSDISFLAFLSKEGKEELQIVGKMESFSRSDRSLKRRRVVPPADTVAASTTLSSDVSIENSNSQV